MIASLMMYARPELRVAQDAYWAALREAMAARGIAAPRRLSNDADPFSVWLSPDLVLSQTCGMPFRLRLRGKVSLVGTPDFGLEGCAPGFYRSAWVVRADDTRETLANYARGRFAFNDRLSQSGFAAAYAEARDAGFWFADRVQSHGHVNSARMVVDQGADIAALDAQTWRLITRYDDFASRLRVLGWTRPTPGLPYITGRGQDPIRIGAAVREAIVAMPAALREALGLCALVDISEAAYCAVRSPPPEAG